MQGCAIHGIPSRTSRCLTSPTCQASPQVWCVIAAATCSNSVRGVRRDKFAMGSETNFLSLSREIEGRPLGGGMLKLESRETETTNGLDDLLVYVQRRLRILASNLLKIPKEALPL